MLQLLLGDLQFSSLTLLQEAAGEFEGFPEEACSCLLSATSPLLNPFSSPEVCKILDLDLSGPLFPLAQLSSRTSSRGVAPSPAGRFPFPAWPLHRLVSKPVSPFLVDEMAEDVQFGGSVAL